MNTVIRYRVAQADDAPAIGEQGRRAFLEAFQDEYTQAEIEGYFAATYGRQLQSSEIADPETLIFLAEDEDGLVGHLKLAPCTLPSVVTTAAAEIKRFYVLRRGQGTGVARALLGLAVEAAQAEGHTDHSAKLAPCQRHCQRPGK